MKKNGLEKKIVHFIEEQRKTTLELKQANEEQRRTTQEIKKLLEEEKKLKAIALGWIREHHLWLKDHHVRLNMHWDEIVKRTTK